MPTTIQVDDSLAKELRAAVKEKYGEVRGNIGKSVKEAIENEIKLLKKE
jgi:hypothetical protein